MKKILLLLLLLPALCFGQMKYTDGHYNQVGNVRIYEPTHFKPIGVILYLHGLGERSDTDLSIIERNEIPKLFRNGIEKPFIVICPQLSADKQAWGTGEIYPMFNLVDAYCRIYKVDRHVTGLSLGGMGTYAAVIWAYTYNGFKPGYWKTAGAVCGRTSTADIAPFSGTAVKIWHGLKDNTVSAAPDQSLFNKLTAARYDVQAVFYPDAGHNIWNLAYADGEYWKWLESKTQPLPTEPNINTPLSDTVHLKIITDRPYVIEP